MLGSSCGARRLSTLLLVDGDIFIYTAAFAVERETRWDDDTFSLTADLDEAKEAFKELVDSARRMVDDKKVQTLVVLTPAGPTFRHEIWPTYKAGRKRRPLVHRALREWAIEHYESRVKEGLEADDALGILATHPGYANRRRIIATKDKDLKTIPGELLNVGTGDTQHVSEEEADLFHLVQTLTGDTTDNYPGCPGIGPKRAVPIAGAGWQAIVAAYEKAGLTEADALIQARLARILRYTDYDHDKKEPILWTPN